MDHLIEFDTAFTADLEVSPRQRLEQLRVQQGTRAYVRLRRHVLEAADRPVEVADLFFEDGSVARDMRFDRFHFAT
jgi:hypothetical protein